MTILSDKTIKKKIANNELVPNGNADSATHCSYEFTAASMLRGGSNKAEQIRGSGVVIEPAQLVWIRAREEISIPANMVGLWIQTQTLARRGLLLLNITLIEPGYEGPLSAVLVNFGNKKVIIRPDTKIAKVVFLTLDSKADELVGKWDSKTYDAKLLDIAANAPTSFLQLESFLPNIEERAKAKLEVMDKEIERNVATIASETRYSLEKDLRTDMRGFFRKWGIGLFAGFLTGCATVLILMTTFLPRLAAEYSGVEELARKASMLQQAETITGLTKEIESLKKQFSDLKTGDNKLQLHNDTSETTPLPDANNTVSNQ